MNRRFIRTPLRHGVAPKAVRKPQRCVVATSTSACSGAGPCRNSPPFVQAFFRGPCRYPFPLGEHVTTKSGPLGGAVSARPPPRNLRRGCGGAAPCLDGGGYQQSEGYVSETAPLRSYSVKFSLSPFTCCRAWYSYSVKFPLSPFAPGCSQVFGLDTSILVCTTSLCKSEATV